MNEYQLAQRRQLRQENQQRRIQQQPIMQNTPEMSYQQTMPMMPTVVETPIKLLLDPIVHAYRNAFRRCGYSRVIGFSLDNRLLLIEYCLISALLFHYRAHNSLFTLVMQLHSLLFIWLTCSHQPSAR
jgi:hypothetical protein